VFASLLIPSSARLLRRILSKSEIFWFQPASQFHLFFADFALISLLRLLILRRYLRPILQELIRLVLRFEIQTCSPLLVLVPNVWPPDIGPLLVELPGVALSTESLAIKPAGVGPKLIPTSSGLQHKPSNGSPRSRPLPSPASWPPSSPALILRLKPKWRILRNWCLQRICNLFFPIFFCRVPPRPARRPLHIPGSITTFRPATGVLLFHLNSAIFPPH
jgi:hypothetical protein